jgi:hypothetical protein
MSGSIYARLLDLAYDIAPFISPDNENIIQNENRDKYIFLGLTTFDQQKARDEIRRELMHYGYQVLPSAKIPLTKEEFEKSIVGYLEKSSIVIQLMGAQYGEMLQGTKHSVMDYQNKLIREFQQRDNGNKLRRYIWIPQNNKISDQRQALYLKRMRRDDATANTEIIESPLENFKTILAQKIEDSYPVEKTESENISKVYLLAEENSSTDTDEVYSTLSLSGLKVGTLDYEEQTGIYARHLKLLKDSDAVIIYQGSMNSFWLSSKLRDLVKSPGLGRKKAFKKVIIVTKLLPDAQLISMIKSKVEIMDRTTSNPESILQKLISE